MRFEPPEAETKANIGVRYLRRVVAVRFLYERDLALQGNDEEIGLKRKGVFLAAWMFEFDAFFPSHLKQFRNSGKGTVNYFYLSSTTTRFHGVKRY